jgi:two-component sensor histidine kinase
MHAKRNWDGLMQVQSQFKGTDKEGTSSEAKKIGLVLDEALSNSFRHGKASKVKITLEASKDTLKLSVIDNGIGPTNGAEGMGSQTFDAIAGSSWELAADQEIGSRFTLALRRS